MRIGMPGPVQPNLSRNKNIKPSLLSGGLRLFSIALIFAIASAAGHAAPNHATAESPAAKRGDAIFHKRCTMCHNQKPDDAPAPFGPPNLYQVFRHKTITTAQATKIIHQGKGAMPSFGTTITDSQIRDVIAYLSAH